ncbi:jg2737 [Pararge aegeria aegeria]|uniref:Jg2737 protein n=1 Tax=Pararge aegeria aegeria TaxID=348720 RepID=A0A8S4RDY0_9NEOP|nr:jg2737 [Pararge aegeria aegeria]
MPYEADANVQHYKYFVTMTASRVLNVLFHLSSFILCLERADVWRWMKHETHNAPNGVVERLGSSATLQEALGDLGGLLSSAGCSDPAGSRISVHKYNRRFRATQ